MSKLGAVHRRGSSGRSDRLGPWRTTLLCVGGALALVTGLFAVAASEVGADRWHRPDGGWTGATAPLPVQPAPEPERGAARLQRVLRQRGVLRADGRLRHRLGQRRPTSASSRVGNGRPTACPCRPVPRPSFVGTIDDVTCPTDQFCVGVGAFGDPSSNDQAPLVSTYANGQWTSTAGHPAGRRRDLEPGRRARRTSRACRPTSCVAVGSYNSDASGNPSYGLLATLSGTTWSAMQAPEPTDAVRQPERLARRSLVSCPVDLRGRR